MGTTNVNPVRQLTRAADRKRIERCAKRHTEVTPALLQLPRLFQRQLCKSGFQKNLPAVGDYMIGRYTGAQIRK